MKDRVGVRSSSASWIGPAALLAAGAAVGGVLWQMQGASVLFWSVVGLFALAALGGGWLSRVLAARRLFAALDAYAAKELARSERRPAAAHSR
jgi:hypothetical protein